MNADPASAHDPGAPGQPGRPAMPAAEKIRCVLLVMAGTVVFLFLDHYQGPYAGTVRGQGGNVAVSFSLYFLLLIPFWRTRSPRIMAAIAALAAVQLFEATNGFGVMGNVHDPLDYLANALGIGAALGIDALMDLSDRRPPGGVG